MIRRWPGWVVLGCAGCALAAIPSGPDHSTERLPEVRIMPGVKCEEREGGAVFVCDVEEVLVWAAQACLEKRCCGESQ